MAGNSLAKYYEYSDVKPGIFGNVWLSAGTSDGLYQFDLGGKNIGYKDQYVLVECIEGRQFYFNFGWDQSPHLYSTSAYTPFNVNGGALTSECLAAPPARPPRLLLAPLCSHRSTSASSVILPRPMLGGRRTMLGTSAPNIRIWIVPERRLA